MYVCGPPLESSAGDEENDPDEKDLLPKKTAAGAADSVVVPMQEPRSIESSLSDLSETRAPRHSENSCCKMATFLRSFVERDSWLFSRLRGRKKVFISATKKLEIFAMPGCPGEAP